MLEDFASGAANALKATSTLSASTQVGRLPQELDTLGNWISRLQEQTNYMYSDHDINAIAKTWVADEHSPLEEYYGEAWRVLKTKLEVLRTRAKLRGDTTISEMPEELDGVDSAAFLDLAREFTAGLVPEEWIRALLEEADLDGNGYFGMGEFARLMRALNPTRSLGEQALDRQKARQWMHIRMTKHKATDRLQYITKCWQSQMTNRIVSSWVANTTTGLARLRAALRMLDGTESQIERQMSMYYLGLWKSALLVIQIKAQQMELFQARTDGFDVTAHGASLMSRLLYNIRSKHKQAEMKKVICSFQHGYTATKNRTQRTGMCIRILSRALTRDKKATLQRSLWRWVQACRLDRLCTQMSLNERVTVLRAISRGIYWTRVGDIVLKLRDNFRDQKLDRSRDGARERCALMLQLL